MLINRAGTMAVPFMTMYATQSLHWTLRDAGVLVTLFGVGSIAGASTGGFLVDKIGFRPVQIVASLSAGVLFLFFPMVKSFYPLCALTMALAFVAEAFRPANYTAIASYSAPDKLTRSYSLNRLAINLGWALGVATGGLIASLDYNWLFYVDGMGNILAGLMILLLLPPAHKATTKQGTEPRPATVLRPWQDAFFVRFILLVAVYNTCFFLVFRLVPVFWKTEWKLNESDIGLVMGLNGIIIALFEMALVKRWEGKRPPMQYIIAGCVACAAGYGFLLLPGFGPAIIAVVFMTVLTIGEMLAMPFMNTVIMARSNSFNRGQYAAAYTLSWSVAQVIGPAGGAWIADISGYKALWIVLILLSAAAAYGFSLLSKKAQQQEAFA
jgi:predicted MFS family arabinose efflux permease